MSMVMMPSLSRRAHRLMACPAGIRAGRVFDFIGNDDDDFGKAVKLRR
jgi:hypothetical protein